MYIDMYMCISARTHSDVFLLVYIAPLGAAPQGMITHPYNFIILTNYTILLHLISLSDPV